MSDFLAMQTKSMEEMVEILKREAGELSDLALKKLDDAEKMENAIIAMNPNTPLLDPDSLAEESIEHAAKTQPKKKATKSAKKGRPRGGRVDDKILEFLKEHEGTGYTVPDLAKELGVEANNTLYRAANRLTERGQVTKDVVDDRNTFFITEEKTLPPQTPEEIRLQVQTQGARKEEGEKVKNGEVAIAGQT